MSKHSSSQAGFTLVEVIIAIVILAVGLLAMATTSIYATTQVRVAGLKTEQSLAVQEVVERLRAMPYRDVDDVAEGSAQQIGSFELWWDVSMESQYLKRIEIYTSGPGYRNNGGWVQEAVDTFTVDIAEVQID